MIIGNGTVGRVEKNEGPAERNGFCRNVEKSEGR